MSYSNIITKGFPKLMECWDDTSMPKEWLVLAFDNNPGTIHPYIVIDSDGVVDRLIYARDIFKKGDRLVVTSENALNFHKNAVLIYHSRNASGLFASINNVAPTFFIEDEHVERYIPIEDHFTIDKLAKSLLKTKD